MLTQIKRFSNVESKNYNRRFHFILYALRNVLITLYEQRYPIEYKKSLPKWAGFCLQSCNLFTQFIFYWQRKTVLKRTLACGRH